MSADDVSRHREPTPGELSRREFLAVAGGGILVCVCTGDLLGQYEVVPQPGWPTVPTDLNAFLRVGADGRVTCLTGKIEMGQGAITSLPQLLADELDVPLDTVDIVLGDTDLCPFDMGTFGSLTTRVFGPLLRAAAAEARAVLLELAAEALEVPVDRLRVEAGEVFDPRDSAKRVSYAALAKGKIIERHIEPKPALKPVSELRIVGTPQLHRDSLEKVTGKAEFAGDLRLPGLLAARVLRPPAHGARLTKVDTSAARAMPGVQVVEDGDLIAVLHEHWDVADRALAAIRADFEREDPVVDDETIFDHLLGKTPEGDSVAEDGDLAAGESLASALDEATYLNSYVAHSPIETHTATAKMEGNRVIVWAATQSPFPLQMMVARALEIPTEQVRMITPFVGGGFGGKVRGHQAIEAARLAKLTGRPVQVTWSRDEEFFYDTFRPAAVVKIRSGLNPAGDIVLWDYAVHFAGPGAAEPLYAVPHQRIVSHDNWLRRTLGPHPFAVGAWRAPAANTNVFARESQIDLMAARAGRDPLELRLQNLKEPRMTRVLETAAQRFGWSPAPRPSGRGHGVACAVYADSYVACMAEVRVDRASGEVKVERVVQAMDMGLVVNPAGARIQMEGCITMGLGYALTEEVRFRGGEILDRNFDSYEIPRFSWLPEIETILIDSDDPKPHGCGEPPIVCMGAVVANAIFDATGARLFQLPMTPRRVKEAVSAASA